MLDDAMTVPARGRRFRCPVAISTIVCFVGSSFAPCVASAETREPARELAHAAETTLSGAKSSSAAQPSSDQEERSDEVEAARESPVGDDPLAAHVGSGDDPPHPLVAGRDALLAEATDVRRDRTQAADGSPPRLDAPLALTTGADKSGVTSQAISTPQGSGKIDGMGESFSAQLSTGIATFSVPIALPAARGGAQPSLTLSYSSSGGLGVAGLGWDVGVPFIARQTDRGLPGYDDGSDFRPNQDRFVFNGAQELVPICTVSGALQCACNAEGKGACITGERMPPWSAGAMYFRPRVEGSFQRFFWSPDRRTWRVQDKSGVTLELGVPLDGSGDMGGLDVNPNGACDVTSAGPTPGCEIYKWHLVRQYDAYGGANDPTLPTPTNVVVYRYLQDGGMAYLRDAFHTTPVSAPSTTDTSEYAHHVRLSYEPRTDPTFSYRSGWRIEQRLRLTRVDVASKPFTGGAGDARRMVRRYHLSYEADQHASLLASLELEGRCESATNNPNTIVAEERAQPENGGESLPESTGCPRLPPMKFGYSHVSPLAADGGASVRDLAGYEGFDERIRQMAQSPRHSIDEELSDLFDINADALPDVLVTAPGQYGNDHAVFFNGAGGISDGFGTVEQMGIQPVLGATSNTIKLSNLNVTPLDLDGDASVNLLHMPALRTYSVYDAKLVSSKWTWVGREVPTASGQNAKIDFGRDTLDTRVVDVNFDGLVDVVVSSGTELKTFFSLGRYPGGDGQFGSATLTGAVTAAISNEPVRSCVPWSGTPVRLSDPDIQFADMNGDSIQDIVRIRRGDIQYWPGRGNGVWGTGERDDCPAGTFSDARYIQMESSPQYSDIEGTSLRIDDVNGDGLDDLVQVRFNAVDIWLNVDGSGWTDRHIIRDTPESPSFANRVRLTDVNGSGTRDILWGNSRDYKYIDLQGGQKAGLLTRIENGLGKSTDIEYTTSTAEMLAAEAHGGTCAPESAPWTTPWCSKMPIVALVVKRVTESDNLVVAGKPACNYVTEYSYRDPVFDGRQREFRGFGKARTKRIGDANSPTDLTDSTFLLGECEDETAGNGVNDCSVRERWRDNPREALKGLAVLSEQYSENGVYLATNATTYRLRRLYVGLDGREVRHALASRQQSIVYDTSAGPSTGSSLGEVPVVELEVAQGQASDICDNPDSPPATVKVSRAPLRVRVPSRSAVVQSSLDVDYFGNKILAVANGCTGGPECTAPDERICTYTLPFLPPGERTGWLWRTERSYVRGSAHGSLRNDTTLSYNVQGDTLVTRAALAGTVPLDRFQSTGTAAVAQPPAGASADGLITLSTKAYDPVLGTLRREEAASNRCRDLEYDAGYGVLPLRETIYRSGCGSRPLSTSAEYDRGLALATSATDMQGERTFADYDAIGRPSEIRKPHPSGTGVEPELSTVKFEYFLPGPSNGVSYSIVHTMTQDGPGPESPEYLESYVYVDGLGRALVRLNEADPQAGDDGNWIVSDFTDYDNKLAVRRKHLAFFTNAPPGNFPIAAVPNAPYGRQRYDAFGRQLQTFDLDGTVTLESRYHALSTDAFDAADLEPGQHQGTPASSRKDGHGRVVATTERIHVAGAIEAREVRTQYLPTGEPEVITRVRVGKSDAPLVRWLRYDSLGRMVLNVEPHTSRNFTADTTVNAAPSSEGLKAWRYAYDDAGDLVGTSDARGCGVNFYYDSAGRLLAEDYSPCEPAHAAYTEPNLATGAGVEVLYVYDSVPADFPNDFSSPPPGYDRASPFLVGRLAAVFDRASTKWTSYDARGRVIRMDARITRANAVAADPFSTRYAARWYSKDLAFDAADREVASTTGSTVTDLQGTAVSAHGLPVERNRSAVTTIYTRRGVPSSVNGSYGALVRSVDRAADGVINDIVYGDLASTTTTSSYDNRRRLVSVQTYRGVPGAWSSPPPNYVPAPDLASIPSSTLQLLLQDEDYTYDVVNNPIEIHDWRDAGEWPAGAKPVTRKMRYDDLYRVTRIDYEHGAGSDVWISPFAAENAGEPAAQDPRRARPSPHVGFSQRMLWQSFNYDWLGSATKTDDDAHGFYDRSLGTIANDTASGKPYQLRSATNTGAGGARTGSSTIRYDSGGNLVRMDIARLGSCLPTGADCSQRLEYQWDEVGRLVRARRWDMTAAALAALGEISPTSLPAADLRYLYDAGDKRVLKTAVDTAQAQSHTVYIFDSLELRRAPLVVGEYALSAQTEVPYLLARGVRLARAVFEDTADGEPRVGGARLHVLFELGDHLGSTSLVLDKATSELVERSTYQAYGAGETDYRPERWKGFREDYRFTGKEENVEVGLDYFGKRFYSATLGRWLSADPLALHSPGAADANLYAYVSGSALRATDPLGLAADAAADSFRDAQRSGGVAGEPQGDTDGGVTPDGDLPADAGAEPVTGLPDGGPMHRCGEGAAESHAPSTGERAAELGEKAHPLLHIGEKLAERFHLSVRSVQIPLYGTSYTAFRYLTVGNRPFTQSTPMFRTFSKLGFLSNAPRVLEGGSSALTAFEGGYWTFVLARAAQEGNATEGFRSGLKLMSVGLLFTPPGLLAAPYFNGMIDDLLEGKGGEACPNGCHEIGPTPVFDLQFWRSVTPESLGSGAE